MLNLQILFETGDISYGVLNFARTFLPQSILIVVNIYTQVQIKGVVLVLLFSI